MKKYRMKFWNAVVPRRHLAARRVAWLLMILAAAPVGAQTGGPYIEGTHFVRLPVPVETERPDRVEVVEVFSYACPHCYAFDDTLARWRARVDPNVVDFRRAPAVFNQLYAYYAQAYYAADVLGVGEQVHTPIFEAIHKYGQDLRNPQRMAEIFERYGGVEPSQFEAVLNSMGVIAKVSSFEKGAQRAYGITGVPSMVVNGKYRVDGRMAGDNMTMLAVVDYLVALEHDAAAAGEE